MPAWAMLSLTPSLISADASESLSRTMPGDAGKNRQMQVTAIRQQGDRTALTLRSKDGVTQVDALVSSAASYARRGCEKIVRARRRVEDSTSVRRDEATQPWRFFHILEGCK